MISGLVHGAKARWAAAGVGCCVALGFGLGAVTEARPATPDPFADVPPVLVVAQGRSVETTFVGGSWTTPSGQPVASAAPCIPRLGPRLRLPVRSRAWFDVVLREPVDRVRAFPLVAKGRLTFMRVVPDARDRRRWHVRAPHCQAARPPGRPASKCPTVAASCTTASSWRPSERPNASGRS